MEQKKANARSKGRSKNNVANRSTRKKRSASVRKPDSKSNIAKRDKALKAGQFCPVDERCGACQLLAIPYAGQLTSKQAEIEELFADALAEDGATIQSILGMDEPLHYRTRLFRLMHQGNVRFQKRMLKIRSIRRNKERASEMSRTEASNVRSSVACMQRVRIVSSPPMNA